MRILIIHTAYTQRGGEDAVLESESQLLKQEHEVSILRFNNADLEQYKLLQLVPKLIYNRSAAAKVEAHITDFKPDVIHIHNLFYIASPSILYAAKKHQIPVVMTLHNFRLICSGALLLRDGKVCELCVDKKFPLAGIKHGCFQGSKAKTAQLTATVGIHKSLGSWKNKVDRYLVFSPFLKQRFLDSSLQIKEEQLSVKPNFVEDFGFSPMSNRQSSYLFIGRLSIEKGIDTLIEAAKLGGFEIDIIGGGDLEGLVQSAAESHPNIRFHGFQKRPFILEKLKSCKALIFPSIWYEGMPITILESLSTGTPILISNQKNVGDFITHEKDGLQFEAGSAAALVSAVNEFDRVQAESYYLEARKKYEEMYTPAVNLKMLTAVYESVVKG